MSRERAVEVVVVLVGAMLVAALIFDVAWPIVVALVLIGMMLFARSLTLLVATYWMKFSEMLGKVMSTIILFLTFFVFLTPIALAYRAIKGQNMLLLCSKRKSFFLNRAHVFVAKDIQNMW